MSWNHRNRSIQIKWLFRSLFHLLTRTAPVNLNVASVMITCPPNPRVLFFFPVYMSISRVTVKLCSMNLCPCRHSSVKPNMIIHVAEFLPGLQFLLARVPWRPGVVWNLLQTDAFMVIGCCFLLNFPIISRSYPLKTSRRSSSNSSETFPAFMTF